MEFGLSENYNCKRTDKITNKGKQDTDPVYFNVEKW